MSEPVLEQLAALNRISRIALQDMALRPMLQRIVDALHEAFGWEFIAIAGIDHARNEFVCNAVHASAEGEVRVGYRRALGSGVGDRKLPRTDMASRPRTWCTAYRTCGMEL